MRKIVYGITLGTWGGAQAHLYTLIAYQVKQGNRVWLYTGCYGKLTRLVVKQLPTVSVIVEPTLCRHISPLQDLKACWHFRRLLKQIRPDLIHLHSAKAGTIGRLAGFKVAPVIYTVHGWAFTTGVSKLRAFVATMVEKSLQSLTSRYICVSQFDYQLGLQKGLMKQQHPGVIIHNGIAKLAAITVSKQSATFQVVMAARFDVPKRQDLLIEALRYVKYTDTTITFLGTGPCKTACEALVKKYGLQQRVRFLGAVNDVQHYYVSADVVALISDYEALPLCLIEAMAVGKSVVASEVGGVGELVTDNGLLVANQPQKIAAALDYVRTYDSIRHTMQRQAKRHFRRKFTSELMLNKTTKIYQELLEG